MMEVAAEVRGGRSAIAHGAFRRGPAEEVVSITARHACPGCVSDIEAGAMTGFF